MHMYKKILKDATELRLINFFFIFESWSDVSFLLFLNKGGLVSQQATNWGFLGFWNEGWICQSRCCLNDVLYYWET